MELVTHQGCLVCVDFSRYWSWNRVIDALFVMDLVMNFFLGFEDDLEGTVVRDVKVIAKRYAQSWFVVDFVSVRLFEVGMACVTA